MLKCDVFKFLENGVNFDFSFFFFNVSKCYLLLTRSCLHLGTLELYFVSYVEIVVMEAFIYNALFVFRF